MTRLESLGATRIQVGQPSHAAWVVMADPEGNEFCVLESLTLKQRSELDAIVKARLGP